MSVIEVAIGYAREPGRFRVQVVDSPVGHASADVDLDVDGLLAGRERFEQTLLLSGIAARRNPTAEEKLVTDAGKALFTALLGTGEVAGRYRATGAVADERGEDLRIVLRIDAPELAALPWEAMYDEGAGGYVCRQHQLVRHVPVASAPPRLPVQPPLRVLGVISAPGDLPPLDVERERGQLARALAEPVKNGLVELAWAPEATWAAIHDQLMAGEWHVLHFIGHGDFDPERDEGRLALTGEDGMSDDVEASRFADLLRQARPMPRLVMLNSCQGATASTGDLFSGTAATLARSGVSAVAAMQYSISDSAAIAFARGFYTALARARGVDDAVSAGRIAILGTSGQTLEWVTPALYLRGNDARLFDVSPGVPASAQLADVRDQQPRGVLPSSRLGPRLLLTLASHTGAVTQAAFNPDGTMLATGSDDHSISLWNTTTGSEVRVLRGHDSAVRGVGFSRDGNLLGSYSAEGKALRLWDVASGASAHLLSGHTYPVSAAAFSPDGTLLATASWDQTTRLWNVASGQTQHVLAYSSRAARFWARRGIRGVAFSPDSGLVATGGHDGKARIWDSATGGLVHVLAGHTAAVYRVGFSRDGSLLATVSEDLTVRLWNVGAGELTFVLSGHESAVNGLAFSPDGRLLATAGDRTVRLWHPDTGKYQQILVGHTGTVRSAGFSPDGALLVTASQDKTARVWDIAARRFAVLAGHGAVVRGAIFSPDGTLVATISDDKTARIWAL